MTTGMQVMTIRAGNNAPLLGGVENNLILTADYTPAVIPAGAIIRDIYFKSVSPLTPDVVLSFGVAGNSGWFVPASVGLNTTDLNNNQTLGYEPNGLRLPTPNQYNLVINPSANCSGLIEIYVEYMVYDNLV